MPNFKKEPFFTLFFLFVLLILFCLTLLPFVLNPSQNYFLSSTQDFILNIWPDSQSNALIWIQNNRINLSFSFNNADKMKIGTMLKYEGISQPWPRNLSLKVDDNSTSFLAHFLPIQTSITVTKNTIIFGDFHLDRNLLLHSELSGSNGHADNSNITFSKQNDLINLQINDPSAVYKEAEDNGSLQFYSIGFKQSLWNIISKLDKIALQLKKGYLQGEVVFKNNS